MSINKKLILKAGGWEKSSWSEYSHGVYFKDVGPFVLSVVNGITFRIAVNGVVFHRQRVNDKDHLADQCRTFIEAVLEGTLPKWIREGYYV